MFIKSIILGIIEGLTEFLPVSSTGHLIIVSEMLKLDDTFSNVFNIVIQMGAILSVLIYFSKEIFPKSFEKSDLLDFTKLWSKVVVGVLPAAIIGILFEDVIDKYLFNSFTVALALILGGFWILYIEGENIFFKNGLGQKNIRNFEEIVEKDRLIDDISDLTYMQSLKIGLFQCLALIPGASRSAMTIIGGLITGTTRQLAAKFSFFMAIPVLMGAGLIKLMKSAISFTTIEIYSLIIGTVVSFVVAYVVIAIFMSYIRKNKFTIFAYYRIILGFVIIIVSFF